MLETSKGGRPAVAAKRKPPPPADKCENNNLVVTVNSVHISQDLPRTMTVESEPGPRVGPKPKVMAGVGGAPPPPPPGSAVPSSQNPVPPGGDNIRVIDLDQLKDKGLREASGEGGLLDTKWMLKQCYHRLHHFNILCVGKYREFFFFFFF